MMKKGSKNVMLKSLLLIFIIGGAGALSMQAEDDLQKLILKKFDVNQDGSLTGQERARAVALLQQADSNGDGKISASEKADAIGKLKAVKAQAPVVKRRVVKKQPQGATKMVRRVSAEELDAHTSELAYAETKKRALLEQQKTVKPEAKPTIKVGGKVRGFYDGSTILAVVDDGVHAVVPQGALINIPPKLNAMVVKKPVGKLLRWPDFLEKYSKLLATREVSWETAKGEDPISDKEKKNFSIAGKIVVAVFKKNPITVLEPPPKEEVEEEAVEGAVASDSSKKKK